MSAYANGSIEVILKTPVPTEELEEARGSGDVYTDGKNLEIDFDGNWYFDSIIDLMKPLNKYIKSGTITYWCEEDNGNARAIFVNGGWKEEWEQTYYESDLPNIDISSTKRVSEILNAIADDYAYCTGISETKEMFEKFGLTEEEFKLYGLDWLTPEGE